MQRSHINYAQLRRLSRRRSIQEVSNVPSAFYYHKMSQKYTDNFPIPQVIQIKEGDVTEKQINNYLNEPSQIRLTKVQPDNASQSIDEITFSKNNWDQSFQNLDHLSPKQSSDKNEKLFSFERFNIQINKFKTSKQSLNESQFFKPIKNNFTGRDFLTSLDEYLGYLSNSENIINRKGTYQSESQSLETQLINKLNLIREHYSDLLKRYEELQIKNEELKLLYESVLSQNMSQNEKYYKLKMRYKILNQENLELIEKVQNTQIQNKFLKNSVIIEQIEKENKELLENMKLSENNTGKLSFNLMEKQRAASEGRQGTKILQNIHKNIKREIASMILQKQVDLFQKNNLQIERVLGMRSSHSQLYQIDQTLN